MTMFQLGITDYRALQATPEAVLVYGLGLLRAVKDQSEAKSAALARSRAAK
jgi:hypothetical protein